MDPFTSPMLRIHGSLFKNASTCDCHQEPQWQFSEGSFRPRADGMLRASGKFISKQIQGSMDKLKTEFGEKTDELPLKYYFMYILSLFFIIEIVKKMI